VAQHLDSFAREGARVVAYDPGGVPDAYYLIDPNGHITYANSIPVSTMGAPLAHLHHMDGRASSHATTSARTED
jgi:hypothetical protein